MSDELGRRDIRFLVKSLKELAGELNIAVLALSQFNRGPAREDRTPRLSDLRDSGSVEQEADVVLLLHDKVDTEEPVREVKLIVANNRRGTTWVTVPLRF